MRVVFANIPCLRYIIRRKGKFSWKNLQTNSLISLLPLLVLYGKTVYITTDPIGDTNCRNAYVHGGNAWYIFKYLPKLVNK